MSESIRPTTDSVPPPLTEVPGRAGRPAGIVLATQLLAIAGWLPIGLAAAYIALDPASRFTSEPITDPMARMTVVVRVLTFVPLLATVPILAVALALHRGWRHARIAALAVAWSTVPIVLLDPLGLGLLPGIAGGAVALGAFLTLCLAFPRRRAGALEVPSAREAADWPAQGGQPPRSRRLAVLAAACWALAALGVGPLLLVIVGVAGILHWEPPPSWADIVLMAAGTAVIVGGVALTARGIAARSPIARDFGPATIAVAAPWAAGWLVLLAGSTRGDEDSSLSVLGLALTLCGLLALAVVPFSIGALVTHRRAFVVAASGPPGARRPARRLGFAAAAVLGVAVIALGVAGSLMTVEPLGWGSIRFEGRTYDLVTSVTASLDDLVAVGALDDWAPNLGIAEATAYALPGVDPSEAVAVRGPSGDILPALPVDLYVREGEPVPIGWCRYVAVDDPEQPPGPCGPPESINFDGRSYHAETEILVDASDVLDPARSAATSESLPPDFDLGVRSIRDVDPNVAVALRVGDRVVLYLADEARLAYGHPLCAYPRLSTEPVMACLGFDERLMVAEVDGREFEIELDLFEIPRDTLSPIGTFHAYGGVGDANGPAAKAGGLDGQAYAIDGVPPDRAVALIIDGRVRVARLNDGSDAVPSGLCRYLRDDGRAFLEGADKGGGGLASYGC